MIFEFADTVKEIDFSDISEKHNTVAYISESEFENFHINFGFDQNDYRVFCRDDRNFRSNILNFNNYCYGTLIIIEPDINNSSENRLAFYIRRNMVLIIEISDSNHTVYKRFIEAVERIRSEEFKPERFIFTFIDSLISSDNKELENIEIEINRIEDLIIRENQYKNFNEELLKYKRKLLKLRNYYEQLIDIGESLNENESNIFDECNLSYFKSFIRKSERLVSDVNLLRDNIIQLREIHQTSLDMKLNNTMKLFTVITAIFSPLTLIVGWYGMNFRYMPELSWKYGYFFVIILSILTVVICICIFKKKKFI